jgi:phytoene synthase
MSDPGQRGEAAGFCAELVRSHDFVRYASTLLVPASERRPLLALYAFNVEMAAVVD